MSKRKIKRLAKKSLKNKWSQSITPENYLEDVAGDCVFCKDAAKKYYERWACENCVLPKVFCYGGLYESNLIGIIHKNLGVNRKIFCKSVSLIKKGMYELKRKGKLQESTGKEMIAFVKANSEIVSEILKKSKKIEHNFLGEEFEL